MISESKIIKSNVSFHEYNMHNYIYNLKILNVPKIISYDKDKKELTMEKISGMNLSDFYGENIIDVPCNIIKEVQTIIKTLKFYNIIYPDITGYNFIKSNNKIWIIDFEHSYFCFDSQNYDPFVDKFIQGTKLWNPDFL